MVVIKECPECGNNRAYIVGVRKNQVRYTINGILPYETIQYRCTVCKHNYSEGRNLLCLHSL